MFLLFNKTAFHILYYGFHLAIKLLDMSIFTYIYDDCYIIIGSIKKI